MFSRAKVSSEFVPTSPRQRYLRMRALAVAGGVIGAAVSAFIVGLLAPTLSGEWLSSGSVAASFTWVAVTLAGPVGIGFWTQHALRQITALETRTVAWYRDTYPNARGANNRLACHACGGAKLHVRRVRQHVDHREHFCADCGKTLFYSPE